MTDTIGALPELDDGASIGHRAAIGAGWLVGFRMLTRSLGVVSTLALARILVPADFGLIAMATTFTAAVDSLSQVGLQDTLLRRQEEDQALFNTAFTLQLLRSLITGGIVALSALPVSRWFGEPRLIPVLFVLAAITATNGLENIAVFQFRVTLRYDKTFRLMAVPRIIQFCVTIALAFALHSYWALMGGVATSQIVRLSMGYALHPFRPRLSLQGWRKLAGFSFWLWLTSLACLVWDRCDPFILGHGLGAGGVGLYLLAVEVATLPVTELVVPATDVLFASFAKAEKHGRDTTSLALSVAATLLLAIAPVAITISAASAYVVSALLGPRWAPAQPLVTILACTCFLSPFAYVCQSVLMASGRVRSNFGANLISATGRVLLMSAAVALDGRLLMAAYAAFAASCLECCVFVALLARSGDARLREMAFTLPRIAAGCLAALLAVRATGLAWQPGTLPPLAALFWSGVLGVVALSAYAPTVALTWWLGGCPGGPETRLVETAASLLVPMLRRLRRTPA